MIYKDWGSIIYHLDPELEGDLLPLVPLRRSALRLLCLRLGLLLPLPDLLCFLFIGDFLEGDDELEDDLLWCFFFGGDAEAELDALRFL